MVERPSGSASEGRLGGRFSAERVGRICRAGASVTRAESPLDGGELMAAFDPRATFRGSASRSKGLSVRLGVSAISRFDQRGPRCAGGDRHGPADRAFRAGRLAHRRPPQPPSARRRPLHAAVVRETFRLRIKRNGRWRAVGLAALRRRNPCCLTRTRLHPIRDVRKTDLKPECTLPIRLADTCASDKTIFAKWR